jgi:hypothetical protein
MRGTTWTAKSGAIAAGNTTVLAAVSGATHYVTKIVVTVYVFQNDGTISLTDGTTTFFEWLAKDGNGSHFEITFDPTLAFPWGTGKAIVLTIGTSNVSCKVVMQGFTKY